MVVDARLYVLFQYFNYFLDKVDRHSLHSPFLFTCYSALLNHRYRKDAADAQLEAMREKWLKKNEVYPWEDKGAGSHAKGEKTVSKICLNSNSALKYNLLYQYFCGLTPAEYVIELGGSLGINTGYLAQSCKGQLYTFEADPTLIKFAKITLKQACHVEFVQGDIKDTLPGILSAIPKVDFAFLDANHTQSGTLHYFDCLLPKLHERSILIVGDIHWSRGMTRAWKRLIKHPKVTLSLDFFEAGVLFFNPELHRETYVLDY